MSALNVIKKISGRYFSIPFASRVLIWMLVGALCGIFFGTSVLFVKPLGQIFLNLLIMVAIPLVFFNLVAGISSLGNLKDLGRMGSKTMLWYVCSVLVAIVAGIALMTFSGAGKGMNLQGVLTKNIGEIPSIGDLLISMFPTNIFKSFAEGSLIQIVVFSVMLSIVVLQLPPQQKTPVVRTFEMAANLMRNLVELILKFSPVCLAALMAATFAEFGTGILASLGKFILTIYAGHIIMVILYMIVLRLFTGISIPWFLSSTKQLYATAAATCSTLASLSVAMDIADTKLKLPKKVYSFSLPLGAQFNKDGTALMLSGILIFTAQAVGIQFSFAELFQVMIVGLLVVEGSSGIPGGGLVTAMLFAKAFNLPVEIVAIVGGIYRLIDMGNTTINVMGDMVVTTIISRSETDWKPE